MPQAVTFTVVVTVHRRTELVPCILFGMLRQTWPGWELIVVADGPHPAARSIVDNFRAAAPDVADRVRYLACPAAPGSWGNVARLRGLELAAGDYTAFLGHDCIALPGYLAAHAENVAREPGCLSLVDVDMWATRTSGRAEVLLPHAEYRGVLPRRDRPPAALEIGDVDLTCMAFPTAKARELHVFAERPQRYRADYADAYLICAGAMPVLHRPGVVAGHF
jgi:glycosyltransferase involved in cell wall biosynthesis